MRPSSTSWASQILSKSVFGMSAPPQAGCDDGDELRWLRGLILEVVWKVRVESDAVARGELVDLAVGDERQCALEDDRRLAGPGLMERWVVRAARRGRRIEGVRGDVGALTRKRRRELADLMPAAPANPPLPRSDDHRMTGLIETQQLRERQLEPAGDPPGDRQRRAGLAAFGLGEHRRAHARAGGQVAQREVHAFAQRPDPVADSSVLGCECAHRPYVITYERMFIVERPSAVRRLDGRGSR